MNTIESTATESTVTEVTQTVAPTIEVAAKALSKMSQADAIFRQHLAQRAQGAFASNRDFRHAVLVAIETALDVSRASASTMYNTSKKAAEAAAPTVGLGRDPKKEKPVSSGKRGRPVGSKNKPKVVTVTVTAETPVASVVPADVQPESVSAEVALPA